MEFEKCTKEAFVVIGKEGSTNDGDGFIEKLWADANAHYSEIEHLVKKDDEGNMGLWGAMSDFTRSFKTWEDNYEKGLYLAGAECVNEAEAPEGWVKWVIPAYEYIYVEKENKDTFNNTIPILKEKDILPIAAVHEFICPKTNKVYFFFPVRKL